MYCEQGRIQDFERGVSKQVGGGAGGMSPRKILKSGCSEVNSEAFRRCLKATMVRSSAHGYSHLYTFLGSAVVSLACTVPLRPLPGRTAKPPARLRRSRLGGGTRCHGVSRSRVSAVRAHVLDAKPNDSRDPWLARAHKDTRGVRRAPPTSRAPRAARWKLAGVSGQRETPLKYAPAQ